MFSGYVDLSILPAFLVAVGLVLIAPGPDMAFMVTAGLAGGRPAATRAAFGITSGVLVYVVAVTVGLGTVVAGHPGVLTGIQLLGAAYLARLAYTAIRESRGDVDRPAESGTRRWFTRGFVVNLTNPKIALFFLAFLPQFLGASSTNPARQLLVLGVLLQLSGLVVDLLVGWTAGAFRERVLRKPGPLRRLTLTSAVVFASLAAFIVADVLMRLA
jgi:threonine/homoserine/homoserine lactone efflux protein